LIWEILLGIKNYENQGKQLELPNWKEDGNINNIGLQSHENNIISISEIQNKESSDLLVNNSVDIKSSETIDNEEQNDEEGDGDGEQLKSTDGEALTNSSREFLFRVSLIWSSDVKMGKILNRQRKKN